MSSSTTSASSTGRCGSSRARTGTGRCRQRSTARRRAIPYGASIETVAGLVAEGGIVSATGRAGTALIFGDCLVHASPPNLSPWDRRIFSLIVNPIANAYSRTQRPDYKHHRDLMPISPLHDDCLMAAPGIAAQ
jgi:hypothetical protein